MWRRWRCIIVCGGVRGGVRGGVELHEIPRATSSRRETSHGDVRARLGAHAVAIPHRHRERDVARRKVRREAGAGLSTRERSSLAAAHTAVVQGRGMFTPPQKINRASTRLFHRSQPIKNAYSPRAKPRIERMRVRVNRLWAL